ncbi:hypothetical protein DQ04_00321240 [Trypanosoma grayi]|uniref:hypothetical protein n=1 Tax=Trypanosoma grayi TaxID=71804 RepID=UPI0004F4309A|nr:hypothetical protein DQ04_00321240 [Trypanosoma grayi]KEG14755.1 hypothetical protein DQ04_00321240 [Trypanosoma grayi]
MLPWYRDDLGSVLELGVGATSKIERFAVIADSVKARKIVVGEGHASKTYFVVGNEERDLLEAKFDDLLKRETNVVTTEAVSVATSEKPTEERRPMSATNHTRELSDDIEGGNSEVFAWKNHYIMEYGNRIFYVCSALYGNKTGFKVERLIRKGVTIYLLFQDENAGPCRVSETQEGEKVTTSSILDGNDGKLMVMMTSSRGVVMRRSREVSECTRSEPSFKAVRKESLRVDPPQYRTLKVAGVNLWKDFDKRPENLMNLVDLFPFTSDDGDSVRTTVFSDGTCVTYNAATAAKYAGRKKVVATPTDCDMMGLLENIQLAKEQFNAM